MNIKDFSTVVTDEIPSFWIVSEVPYPENLDSANWINRIAGFPDEKALHELYCGSEIPEELMDKQVISMQHHDYALFAGTSVFVGQHSTFPEGISGYIITVK